VKSRACEVPEIESIDNWKPKVVDIAAVDFETANFTKPVQSGE